MMKEDLFDMLKEKSYRKGEFTLSSGRTSEHYMNCKPVILNGIGLFYASCLLTEFVEEDSVSVAGLTLGADPLVSGVAVVSALDEVFLNALIIRKEGYEVNRVVTIVDRQEGATEAMKMKGLELCSIFKLEEFYA